MSRYKPNMFKTTALAAIETMFSLAEELGEEAREVWDAMPQSLQSGGRGESFESTASTLEGLQMPDEPENCPDPECQVIEMVRGGKKRGQESRATRTSNAAAHGRAGADALRAWADVQDELLQDEPENPDHDLLSDIRDYADEIESVCDEIEGCEFPGMYG